MEVLGTIPHGVAPSETVTATFSLNGFEVTDFTSLVKQKVRDTRHSFVHLIIPHSTTKSIIGYWAEAATSSQFSLLFDYLFCASSSSTEFTQDSRTVTDERDSQLSFSDVAGSDVVSSEAYLRGTATSYPTQTKPIESSLIVCRMSYIYFFFSWPLSDRKQNRSLRLCARYKINRNIL